MISFSGFDDGKYLTVDGKYLTIMISFSGFDDGKYLTIHQKFFHCCNYPTFKVISSNDSKDLEINTWCGYFLCQTPTLITIASPGFQNRPALMSHSRPTRDETHDLQIALPRTLMLRGGVSYTSGTPHSRLIHAHFKL